jgi:tetratricopeptide (TPR) repeat protein
VNPALERHREQFEADPTRTTSFEALEEHYFLEGAWPDLVGLYRRRLEAADVQKKANLRSRLLFRLGQVLDERCQDTGEALLCYEEAARLAPDFQPALQRLRQIYADREQWELALQVGELEAGTPMRPAERAGFQCELGAIWLERMGDAEQALDLFKRALAADARCAGALRGGARALQRLGRGSEAVPFWERLIAQSEGPERSEARLGLAALFERDLADTGRALDVYAQALAHDPEDGNVLESMLGTAVAAGRWELVGDLSERRFDLAAGAQRRVAIALETAEILLSRNDTAWARAWLERAGELAPEDPEVALALADACGRLHDEDARATHLERAFRLAPERVPGDVLADLGARRAEAGDQQHAIALLRGALDASPGDVEVLDALVAAHEQAGRHDELVDLLESRAALAGGDAAARGAALVQLGALHERHLDDADSALDAYRRALETHSGAAGAGVALDRLLRKREAWTELGDVLERAGEAAPTGERPSLLCSLGELYLGPLRESRADAAARARVAFERALDCDGEYGRALKGLERVATETGDEEALLAALVREAEVTADPSRKLELLWQLTRRHEAREDAEGAARWAERLIQETPDDVEALEHCAAIHARLGHDAELVRVLERLAAVAPATGRAAAQRRLADVHGRAERPESAIDAWLAALEANPDDLESLQALVQPLAQAGRGRDLARVYRSLAERLTGAERADVLWRLAGLLADELDDPDASVVALWRLVEDPDAPPEVDDRLEALLERTGRFEELAQRLGERRHTLEDAEPEAVELDLRRAEVLGSRLQQVEAAAPLYRSVYERLDAIGSDAETRRSEVLDGLERCARAGGADEDLVWVLARRAEASDDPATRGELLFERAVRIEEALDQLDAASDAYAELVDAGGPRTAEARERLMHLLERRGDWNGLRTRLEEAASDAVAERACGLHERLAQLCLERLDDRSGAIAHLEQAAELAPEQPGTWARLADLYREAERPAEALSAIERELATGPDPERERTLRAYAAVLCRDTLDDGDAARSQFERVLELDPGQADAVAYLAECYEDEGRTPELVALLAGRMERLEASPERVDHDRAVSLRVRLAELEESEGAGVERAIALLEPAVADGARSVAAAEPAAEALATRYENAGLWPELAVLARRRAGECRDVAARADWNLRLGNAQRELGEHSAAVAAFREVVGARPGDPEAEAALRDLHRAMNESEPLARLLEAQLAELGGPDEVPVRLELAEILAERIERPAEALVHLRRVLEIAPDHAEARAQALGLAERLGAPDVLIEVLDRALERERVAGERADLLARRGEVLVGPLGRLPEAIASFREAVAFRPDHAPTRQALRDCLEQAQDWPAVLDEIQGAVRMASGPERLALIEEGARLAADELSGDASLPWLERLRSVRPDDPDVLERIADVHRRAGRPEPLLRALEAEVSLREDAGRRRALHLERARILEEDLDSAARAVSALEAAHREHPDDPEILAALDRLYAAAGRPRARAEVLERRIAVAEPELRAALHKEIGELYLETLGDPAAAADHFGRALDGGAGPRIKLLQSRGRALRGSGRAAAWAEVAEAELAALDPGDGVFDERRRALHRELAFVYANELGDPDLAAAHLRALVDAREPSEDDELAQGEREAAESALLARLRADGSHAELGARLARWVERHPDDAPARLELAQLYEERLHEPAAASEHYAAAFEGDGSCLEALRGLRRVEARRGRWESVADALERELEVRPDATVHERAGLLRALGDVCWRRLQSTTRASRAYAGALEAVPDDRASLRALQSLFEAMEDWRGAADFYASELDLLANDEPERRREVQLRIADLASDRIGDLPRAVLALRAADAIEPLEPVRRRELAELHRREGQLPEFAEVMQGWCADPEAPVTSRDQLELVEALESLGRLDEALARAEEATRRDLGESALWLAVARLREELGDPTGAAEALVRAAACSPDGPAAEQLLRAAELQEDSHPESALAQLHAAVERDPGAAEAHAALARVAETTGRLEEAQIAAGRALDLASSRPRFARSLQLATALVGARAARARDELEEAARFAATGRELDADAPEVLAVEGEVLFAMGELAGARRALEARLAAGPESYPGRAGHLELLGRTLETAGEDRPALERFEAALAEDDRFDDARAGIVRLHEHAGRLDEALEARLAWAQRGDASVRADQLARAAELELARSGGDQAAEQHLRAALDIDPTHSQASLLLTTRLAEAGRVDEALELTRGALERAQDPDVRSRLAVLQARMLEQRGDRRGAADAYAVASEADPSGATAALARARILRALGEWDVAADGLRAFAERHPGDDPAALAEVHFQRGRVLAGPLERLEEALDAYRLALDANPRYRAARDALAALLIHRPECWDEALTRHRELLELEPADVPFLRGVLRIAEGRNDEAGAARGRAILAALGAATPEEGRRANGLDLQVGEPASLENPVWECTRRAVATAADEIARALDASSQVPEPAAAEADPRAAFRSAALTAEGELAAAALVPLDDEDLAEVVRITAGLAVDADHVHGDGHRVNALSRELGRRARRRVKRELGEIAPGEIAEIDFADWRHELRGLAHARALDAVGGDLRPALLALLQMGEAAEREPAPEADLSALVASEPVAAALLRRVVRAWLDNL